MTHDRLADAAVAGSVQPDTATETAPFRRMQWLAARWDVPLKTLYARHAAGTLGVPTYRLGDNTLRVREADVLAYEQEARTVETAHMGPVSRVEDVQRDTGRILRGPRRADS